MVRPRRVASPPGSGSQTNATGDLRWETARSRGSTRHASTTVQVAWTTPSSCFQRSVADRSHARRCSGRFGRRARETRTQRRGDDSARRFSFELARIPPRLHSRLADAFQVQGDLPRAIENYRKSIALDPSLPGAWWGSGLRPILARRPRRGGGELPQFGLAPTRERLGPAQSGQIPVRARAG